MDRLWRIRTAFWGVKIAFEMIYQQGVYHVAATTVMGWGLRIFLSNVGVHRYERTVVVNSLDEFTAILEYIITCYLKKKLAGQSLNVASRCMVQRASPGSSP